MSVAIRRRFLAASIFLFGLAAAIATPSAVSQKTAPIQASRIVLAGSSPHSRSAADRSCRYLEFTAPSSSFSRRPAGRVFLEDTTPPSGNILETRQLQFAIKPDSLAPLPHPALRSRIAAGANRQRAP